jgi:coenzyme F420-0:L-glutamate ligase/NADPH-dependent F420 reductase
VLGGTGALGAAIVRRLSAAGYEVWIGSRDPAKAEAAAAAIGGMGGPGPVRGAGLADAATRAELCMLAVPYSAHLDTLAQIRGAVQGKIVVDTTVPLRPPKVGTVQLPAAGSAAAEAAHALGKGARVVSAMQNVGAEKLASGEPIEGDVLVCGDDGAAVETVREILLDLGLKSWHAGPLANSAASEALTSVLIQLNRRYKLGQAGIRITGPKEAGAARGGLSVWPAPNLPLFQPGDDLAAAIGDSCSAAGEDLRDGDVVVVAQKIVSKAEGRIVRLADVTPGPRARDVAAASDKDPAIVELALSESQEVVRAAPGVIIYRHRTGHVLANAGIDASNVVGDGGGEAVLLWPHDPDASARAMRAALEARFNVRLAVIISDSLGRAWRVGTTGTAIGVAGMKPIRDRRGEADLFGRELKVTMTGVADEIAAAASLVIGEAAEGTPVAIVRGAVYDRDDAAGVADLLRPVERDLFR